MPRTTHKEAALLLQMAQYGAATGFNSASSWLWSDEFVEDYAEFTKKYPGGSEGSRNVTLICTFFEGLATFWKHDLINEDLLFDWYAPAAYWGRLSGWALGTRKLARNPRIYENFEALAKASVAYDANLTKPAAQGGKESANK